MIVVVCLILNNQKVRGIVYAPQPACGGVFEDGNLSAFYKVANPYNVQGPWLMYDKRINCSIASGLFSIVLCLSDVVH